MALTNTQRQKKYRKKQLSFFEFMTTEINQIQLDIIDINKKIDQLIADHNKRQGELLCSKKQTYKQIR